MGVHSGRPQGVCDTQLGTQAGPSGSLNSTSSLPWVRKEWGEYIFFHCLQHFPFFRNNPVTRISYFSPFSRPCNACCVLPPSWPPVWLEDAAVEVMRSCSSYRSEINVSDLLQQPDFSFEEYLHSIGEFPLQWTARLCLDLVRAIRSDQSTAWMWNAFDAHHQFWFILLYFLFNYHSD